MVTLSPSQAGMATFSGLYVNEEGDGYTLSYVAMNAAGKEILQVDGASEFTVLAGDPFQIAFTTYPGQDGDELSTFWLWPAHTLL